MTKTLGSAALQLYAGTMAMFLPIENLPGLIADLESDPFVGHALSSATCELYHRYGMFLAPLTAALTTLKHCQFRHCCPVRVHDGGDEAGEPRDGGGASTVLQWKELRRKLRIKKSGSRACCPKGKARRMTSRAASSIQGIISHPPNPPPHPPPPVGDGTSANIPPKEAAAVSADKRPEHHEGQANWIPWVVGACLAGGALVFLRNAQTRSPASMATAPVDSAPKQPAPVLRPLFYGMSNHDDSSNRREDDRERALPQRRSLGLGLGTRPAWQDGDWG